MARPPRPERKYELLDQILDFLLDSTLADLTFRSLADALGISSYVLVYHFGNREQLVTEIIHGIMHRYERPQRLKPAAVATVPRGEFLVWARRSFELSLDHRGRHLQRLDFEASVQDVVAEQPRGLGVRSYTAWCAFLASWLRGQGMPQKRAEALGRSSVAAVMGILYDFVITGERERALESFDLLAESFAHQLDLAAERLASSH